MTGMSNTAQILQASRLNEWHFRIDDTFRLAPESLHYPYFSSGH